MRRCDLSRVDREAPNTVRQWFLRGKLPAPSTKLSAGWIWQGTEIEAWIARLRAEAKDRAGSV
jgi:hypothetical protein